MNIGTCVRAGFECVFDKITCVRRSLLIVGFLLAIGILLSGHAFYTTKITWSSDVSRVVYRNCVSCHHPGGTQPSLMTFREARPWAEDIKLQVLQRRMPPWNAVKGFGEFKDDHGLPQEDLEIIAEWVEGGCPEGNPAYMPPTPDFPPTTGGSSTIAGPEMAVNGLGTIKKTIEVEGIGPLQVPESGVLQAIATEPDGTIVPLLWVENFNPTWGSQIYYFREPLRFPAGTRIEISPRSGRVLLHLKAAKSISARSQAH